MHKSMHAIQQRHLGLEKCRDGSQIQQDVRGNRTFTTQPVKKDCSDYRTNRQNEQHYSQSENSVTTEQAAHSRSEAITLGCVARDKEDAKKGQS